MTRLPVIVAQGGVSSAGRSSHFNSYRRLVLEALSAPLRQQTIDSLRVLRNMPEDSSAEDILSGTLVRKLESNLFDSSHIYSHQSMQLEAGSALILPTRRISTPPPAGWQVEDLGDGRSRVTLTDAQTMMLPSYHAATVNTAGQLPSGFEPEKLYQARQHPRSLAMTVFGASDAIDSSGLDWQALRAQLNPNDIAVYSGSAMSQLDTYGNGGLLQAKLLGKRVSSKQCALGFADMSADFINAYLLGSLGGTGTSMGACATLLYNLDRAVKDIRGGQRRLVIVGNSEAPLTSEIMDGYATMGALATDASLRQLDGLAADETPNHRRACRPFGENSGFTIAESCQFFVLMDDQLALQSGAEILGAVADVFVNADGFKKSISAPGAGNHLTVAQAAALAKAIVGEKGLRQRSFVQTHGTGTPQNRVTESLIMNETAKAFGIQQWPIAAVKSYTGHSIGAAGGDQIMATLGVWQHGIIPGIRTVTEIAPDVHNQYLNILLDHYVMDPAEMEVALINAKGFGGNNATAVLLSPQVTQKLLRTRHGAEQMNQWQHRNEAIQHNQSQYEKNMLQGLQKPIYHFGEGVLDSEGIILTSERIRVSGYGGDINLQMENPFWRYE